MTPLPKPRKFSVAVGDRVIARTVHVGRCGCVAAQPPTEHIGVITAIRGDRADIDCGGYALNRDVLSLEYFPTEANIWKTAERLRSQWPENHPEYQRRECPILLHEWHISVDDLVDYL